MFITFKSTRPPPLRQPKSKKKIKDLNVQKLSKIFTSINDSDYEVISSDDEIYLNQLIEPNDFKTEQDDIIDNYDGISLLQDQIEPIDIDYIPVINDSEPTEPIQQQELEPEPINNDDIARDVIRDLDDDVVVELQIEEPTIDVIMNDDDDHVKNVNNHSVIVDGMNNPIEHHQQRIKKKRSLQAKQKKNRKRNNQFRLIRYKYYLTRSYYYRFKSRTVKKVLRYYGVQYRHIKFRDDRVVIGVKTDAARHDYEETLPYNCFNRRNYWRFRK